jgi:hypothetical protein
MWTVDSVMVSSSFVTESNDVTVANAKVEVVHLLWWD